ncbi:MAG: hypothetical protein ACRDIY_05595, partial [Chloroflexota bacterium]
MPRVLSRRSRRFVFALVVACLLGLNAPAAAAPGPRQTLSGHLVPALRGVRARGPTDPGRPARVVVSLPLRDPAQLQSLLERQRDRSD